MSSEITDIEMLQAANAFAVYNHIEPVKLERDHVLYKLDIRPESKNPRGYVHGGALCAMADTAAGVAVHSDGRTYVTQADTMHYLSNRMEGTIYAEGTVIHRGRTICIARADITDETGKLLCTGDFTFFCVGAGKAEKEG